MNMIKVLKEEISKFLKEFYGSTNKQWKEMNKTVQDLKMNLLKKKNRNQGTSGNENFRNSMKNC